MEDVTKALVEKFALPPAHVDSLSEVQKHELYDSLMKVKHDTPNTEVVDVVTTDVVPVVTTDVVLVDVDESPVRSPKELQPPRSKRIYDEHTMTLYKRY